MKFLVDAQLPRRLARWLQAEGHEAVHTLDLPQGNRTGDSAINEISVRELRAVITKDEDFVHMFLLRRQPDKLLLVSTGNISNDELEQLFRTNLEAIVKAFETHGFVELDRSTLTCHRRGQRSSNEEKLNLVEHFLHAVDALPIGHRIRQSEPGQTQQIQLLNNSGRPPCQFAASIMSRYRSRTPTPC